MTSPYIRQRLIFDPSIHADALGALGIIGCGAIGSAVALATAKMGLRTFAVWDPDEVEPHNVPNQLLFAPPHAGQRKVEVAAHSLGQLCGDGLTIGQWVERFPPRWVSQYDTLILAVDSLETRASMWQSVKKRVRPARFLDLRLGNRTACAYALARPFPEEHVARYEALLVEAEDDPCGAQSFVGTSMLAAALSSMILAAWGRGESVPWEVYLSFDAISAPLMMVGE